jgi:cytochrome c
MKGCLSAIALGLLAAAVGCEQFNEPSNLDDGHGGNPRRGQAAIARYGCGSCHTILGIRGAKALVGPPLEHMARRTYIAGVLPNTRQNLITWISNPPEVDEMTAMPNLNVTGQHLVR